ncbi:hypothetical protein ACP275_05G124400 [Erythranthe tilingii]
MAIRRKKITVANKTRHVIGLCACFHGEDSRPSTFKRVIHPNRCTRFRPDVFLDLTIKWKLFTVVCLYVDGVRLPESMDHRDFLHKNYAVVDLGDDGSVKLSFPETAENDEGGLLPFFFRIPLLLLQLMKGLFKKSTVEAPHILPVQAPPPQQQQPTE